MRLTLMCHPLYILGKRMTQFVKPEVTRLKNISTIYQTRFNDLSLRRTSPYMHYEMVQRYQFDRDPLIIGKTLNLGTFLYPCKYYTDHCTNGRHLGINSAVTVLTDTVYSSLKGNRDDISIVSMSVSLGRTQSSQGPHTVLLDFRSNCFRFVCRWSLALINSQ